MLIFCMFMQVMQVFCCLKKQGCFSSLHWSTVMWPLTSQSLMHWPHVHETLQPVACCLFCGLWSSCAAVRLCELLQIVLMVAPVHFVACLVHIFLCCAALFFIPRLVDSQHEMQLCELCCPHLGDGHSLLMDQNEPMTCWMCCCRPAQDSQNFG